MKPVPRAEVARKSLGAAMATVGFLLSPLSWWNDLLVNVPLALAFAWLASWLNRDLFTASFVVGYWLTNILGFVLMHRGAQRFLVKEAKPYRAKQLAWDVGISLFYTAVILLLIKLKVFGPLPIPAN